jgi:hypothetical protein
MKENYMGTANNNTYDQHAMTLNLEIICSHQADQV